MIPKGILRHGTDEPLKKPIKLRAVSLSMIFAPDGAFLRYIRIGEKELRALDVPAQEVRDRVFYGATGRPLITAGEVAEVIRRQILGADIKIGPGLSDEDLLEIRYRGVLSVDNAKEQLGYRPRFSDIHDGVADYVETYRRYLGETAREK
jgi:nucleoside-diphosphate-sugar epimerase